MEATIVALVPDLLASSRIAEAAKLVGARLETADSVDEIRARLELGSVDLLIVDLAIAGLDMLALAGAARSTGAPVAGFYPHVDSRLRNAARKAGIERAYARSRFLRETAGILKEMLGSRESG